MVFMREKENVLLYIWDLSKYAFGVDRKKKCEQSLSIFDKSKGGVSTIHWENLSKDNWNMIKIHLKLDKCLK